ncbi:hypothetical protein [Psychroflexus halocasei]|uniref:Uncharacterized protein n=1 Tax=Psychroflexus halocasei TaxID=908615 RepID=A0A1H4ASR4_9FLAO|nr:hypothetical protein [Psychroflexus halocasei]SEA38891.1 hypothetical protein SAMN05421540_105132 [Psychroflexus halocasei]
MKKFFTIIALGAMTIGMSSFEINENVAGVNHENKDDCFWEARQTSHALFDSGLIQPDSAYNRMRLTLAIADVEC